jgi:hypothetical protein
MTEYPVFVALACFGLGQSCILIQPALHPFFIDSVNEILAVYIDVGASPLLSKTSPWQ